MVWLIAGRRFYLNLLTFRFLVGSLLCILSVLIAGAISVQSFKQKSDYYRPLVTEHERRIQNARRLFDFTGLVVLNQSPLGLANAGIDERFGVAAQVPGVLNPVKVFGRSRGNPFLLSVPTFDLAHVIALILSLLALVLAYNTVSGEREEGTLRLLLSNNLPRDKLIFGEYLGSMLTIALPFLLSLLAWLLLVRFLYPVAFNRDFWIGLGVIFIISLVFLSACVWLAILISSNTRNSPTSIMLCLFVWVLMAILYPDVSSWLATKLRPIEQSEAGYYGEIFGADLRSTARGRELLEELSRLSRREKVIKMSKGLGRELEEAKRRALLEVQAERETGLNRMIRQAELVRALLVFSPISAYLSTTAIIAQTDTGSYIRFRVEADRLQREISRWQLKKLEATGNRTDALVDRGGFPAPSFVATAQGLVESLYRGLPEPLALLLFNLVFFVGSFAAIRKYDPR